MELQLDSAADQPILTALRTGQHRRAATLMVSAYNLTVHRMCCFVARDAPDDLTNQCFSRAFSAFAEFRVSGSPKAWLLSIARECCIEHFRSLPAGTPKSEAATLHADLSANPELVKVQYDGSLTVFERAAIGLRVGAEMEVAEVATLLDVTEDECRGWLLGLVSQMIGQIEETKLTKPRSDTLEIVYPKFLAALMGIKWRVGEPLLRRLEVLAAAL